MKVYRNWSLIAALVAIIAGVGEFRSHRPTGTARTTESGSSWTLFGGIGATGSGNRSDTQRPPIEFSVPVVTEYDGGSFDLENLTVAKYVEKYRQAAISGQDPAAAFRIYQAETMCARTSGIEHRPGEVLDEEAQACVGVNAAMMYERYQFLRQAAQAGVDGAAIEFLREGPAGHVKGDPLPADWAADAISYLQASGQKGNIEALHQLSLAYQQGQLAPPDPQRALTYKAAMVLLQPNHKELESTPIIKYLSSGLSPEQTAAALWEGKAIAEQCCAKH